MSDNPQQQTLSGKTYRRYSFRHPGEERSTRIVVSIDGEPRPFPGRQPGTGTGQVQYLCVGDIRSDEGRLELIQRVSFLSERKVGTVVLMATASQEVVLKELLSGIPTLVRVEAENLVDGTDLSGPADLSLPSAAAARKGRFRFETGPGSFQQQGANRKRVVDLSVSTLALLITLPVLVVAMVAIKLESRGPVFHRSFRVGRGFRIFRLYKFRTVKVGADSMIESMSQIHGRHWHRVYEEAGITRVGRFLHRTGLEGLPQLFNVLAGDMSLVGNRALPLREALRYTVGEQAERFDMPAGIWGSWEWQTLTDGKASSPSTLQAEIAYARAHGLWSDLKTLARGLSRSIMGVLQITAKVQPRRSGDLSSVEWAQQVVKAS